MRKIISDSTSMIIAIILFVLIGIWIQNIRNNDKKWEPTAIHAQEELQLELTNFNILPNAIQNHYESSHDTILAIVSANYNTDKNYKEIRAFYLQEASRNGWSLKKEQLLDNYNFLTWKKGEYICRLQYDKLSRDNLGHFSISFTWNRDTPMFGDKD